MKLVKLWSTLDTNENERTAQSNIIKHMGRKRAEERGGRLFSQRIKSQAPRPRPAGHAAPPFKGFMLRSGVGWLVACPSPTGPQRSFYLLERTFRATVLVRKSTVVNNFGQFMLDDEGR